MDQQLITTALSGGGVVAFAAAVWLTQREIMRTLRSIERMLARLEERADADDRARAATPPRGVPIVVRRRRPPETEED